MSHMNSLQKEFDPIHQNNFSKKTETKTLIFKMVAVHIGTSLTAQSSVYGKIKGENVK